MWPIDPMPVGIHTISAGDTIAYLPKGQRSHLDFVFPRFFFFTFFVALKEVPQVRRLSVIIPRAGKNEFAGHAQRVSLSRAMKKNAFRNNVLNLLAPQSFSAVAYIPQFLRTVDGAIHSPSSLSQARKI